MSKVFVSVGMSLDGDKHKVTIDIVEAIHSPHVTHHLKYAVRKK